MFDRDDLRHFLAVARTGTTLGAARVLKTSQPTVCRRIAALEAAAGVPLFERSRAGYRLTAIGREIEPLAARVEAEAARLADALAAYSRRLAGTIRVTTPESIANVLLAPAVAGFRRTHPGIQIQLLIADRYLDIARGEADVAIRATARDLESSDLVARLLSESPWAVYCSRAYAARAGVPRCRDDLRDHELAGAEGALADFPALRWLRESAPDAQVSWRSNSLTNLFAGVRAGLCVSTLPCLLGGSDPDLVKCFAAGGLESSKIWLVTRADFRELPHARAFIEAVAAHFRASRALLCDEREGEELSGGAARP